MRKVLGGFILLASGVGLTPTPAQAFGHRLFHRDRGQPASVVVVCPPLTDTVAPMGAPKLGYKWVPKQVQETVKITVWERVIIDGRPQLVPVEKTETRTKTVFEQVLDPSSDFGQLITRVNEMREAVGLDNPARDAEKIQDIQKELDKIKLKLASVATLKTDVGANPTTDTSLSVSSPGALAKDKKYRIDSEIIEVTDPPDIAAGTIKVRRGVDGTTATAHRTGALILPEPLPK